MISSNKWEKSMMSGNDLYEIAVFRFHKTIQFNISANDAYI